MRTKLLWLALGTALLLALLLLCLAANALNVTLDGAPLARLGGFGAAGLDLLIGLLACALAACLVLLAILGSSLLLVGAAALVLLIPLSLFLPILLPGALLTLGVLALLRLRRNKKPI